MLHSRGVQFGPSNFKINKVQLHTNKSNGTYSGEELSGGLRENLHHRSRIGKEQRHAVGQLVSDFNVCIFLREFHAVEGTTIVRKVVLNGWVNHLWVMVVSGLIINIYSPSGWGGYQINNYWSGIYLGVIKPQHEIKHISQLFGQSLHVG